MKLRPLSDRVLVRRLHEEEKTKGGLVIPTTAQEQRSEGEVLEVEHLPPEIPKPSARPPASAPSRHDGSLKDIVKEAMDRVNEFSRVI